MRFTVSRVMDMIERRLTTDVTLAQAVVDVGEVIRFVALDGNRPVNLLRIGMVVDALGRYLIDAGAVLYPVAPRALLSESDLTSKERMVLSRWADDGLIEVVPDVTGRDVEVADLTGLPLITVRGVARYGSTYPWLLGSPERVLRLVPRNGGAVLVPGGEEIQPGKIGVVIGKAQVVRKRADGARPAPAAEPAAPQSTTPEPAASEPAVSESEPVSEPAAAESEPTPEPAASEPAESEPGSEPAASEPAASELGASESEPGSEPDPAAEQPAATDDTQPAAADAQPAAKDGNDELPAAVVAFLSRGATRISRTEVMSRRLLRAEPSGIGSALLARRWRCPDEDCPAFGGYRRIGQPVPHMRGGVPACPRHGTALVDLGTRRTAYAVALVIDDLARQRFVVAGDAPVVVGRAPKGENDVSVSEFLHTAAVSWISATHARLTAAEDALVVTDTSRNGTVVWRRSGPEDAGRALRLRRTEYRLGPWDSVELYTGVELVAGEHRRIAAAAGSDLRSVLVDAPTVVMRRPEFTR